MPIRANTHNSATTKRFFHTPLFWTGREKHFVLKHNQQLPRTTLINTVLTSGNQRLYQPDRRSPKSTLTSLFSSDRATEQLMVLETEDDRRTQLEMENRPFSCLVYMGDWSSERTSPLLVNFHKRLGWGYHPEEVQLRFTEFWWCSRERRGREPRAEKREHSGETSSFHTTIHLFINWTTSDIYSPVKLSVTVLLLYDLSPLT